jgi:chaperone modulatory protein CbpM
MSTHDSRHLPERTEFIVWTEFVERSGVPAARIGELIELGWIEPHTTEQGSYLFRAMDIVRARQLERICRDFEISSLAGTIIMDLLDRIQDMERKVRQMERMLWDASDGTSGRP